MHQLHPTEYLIVIKYMESRVTSLMIVFWHKETSKMDQARLCVVYAIIYLNTMILKLFSQVYGPTYIRGIQPTLKLQDISKRMALTTQN